MSYKKNEDINVPWTEKISKARLLLNIKKFEKNSLNFVECQQTLVELVYLINRHDAQSFTPFECSEIFFSSTKLFRNPNPTLRRLLYLIMTSIRHDPETAFMAVSTLIKDLTSLDSPKMFRTNAIKALSFIVDKGVFNDINRYLKQSLLNDDPLVQTASLLAGIKVFAQNEQLVCKWATEAHETLRSSNPVLQQLSLVLLCKIKRSDLVSLRQFVSVNLNRSFLSPAMSYLLTVISSLITTFPDFAENQEVQRFLLDCCKNGSFMVSYEAIRVLTDVYVVLPKTVLNEVDKVLQKLLYSQKNIYKFAALKVLNKHQEKFTATILALKPTFDVLLDSSNKNIASSAIKVLLNISSERYNEKLLKNLNFYFTSLTDDMKISIINAMHSASLKLPPQKQTEMIELLAALLSEEKGINVKKAIIETFVDFIRLRRDLSETCLNCLCEFIEDCEFSELTVKILHLIGELGPRSKSPSRYIRFIYNRIILELPPVRCAAVDALAKFGEKISALKNSVSILLQRCLSDNDDEVRDRATLHLFELQCDSPPKQLNFTKSGVRDLSYSVKLFLKEGRENLFSLVDIVPKKKNLSKATTEDKEIETKIQSPEGGQSATNNGRHTSDEFSFLGIELGEKFAESEFESLTENEFEYITKYKKIVYFGYVVLQFNVANTVEDSVLKNLRICIDDCDYLELEKTIAIKHLLFGEQKSTFVVFKRLKTIFSDKLGCKMQFDSLSGLKTLCEEYILEDIRFRPREFMLPKEIDLETFKARWTELSSSEKVGKFFYKVKEKDIQKIGLSLIRVLSMRNLAFSNKNIDMKDEKCFLNLCADVSGVVDDKVGIFSRVAMAFTGQQHDERLCLQLSIRSLNAAASESLIEYIKEMKL